MRQLTACEMRLMKFYHSNFHILSFTAKSESPAFRSLGYMGIPYYTVVCMYIGQWYLQSNHEILIPQVNYRSL